MEHSVSALYINLSTGWRRVSKEGNSIVGKKLTFRKLAGYNDVAGTNTITYLLPF